MRDCSVVLRQEGEDHGRRAGGEIVHVVEGEWSDEEGEEEWWEECCVWKCREDECLRSGSQLSGSSSA